jgi:superfamily II DNA or RNA helicase
VNATIQLRDYQQAAHDAVIRQYLDGTRRTLIVLPTGAGKTIVFGSVIAKAAAQKCRSLVLAHTEELVD